MAIDYSKVNTDSSYPHSFDISFTPTESPLARQKSDYEQFNKDYTNFLGSQETVGQLQDRYANKYNVPFLQQQAQQQNNQLAMLGNQMQALPQSVASASSNSMLTSGQKARLVQNAQQPLAQQYQNLGAQATATNQALGTAEQNVNQAISAEQAQQMKMTQPWLQKYDFTTIANAAENTQWTQKNQWELDRLLANQSAGVTLSEGQQNRLYQLASQENAFQNSLEYLDKQNQLITEMWSY